MPLDEAAATARLTAASPLLIVHARDRPRASRARRVQEGPNCTKSNGELLQDQYNLISARRYRLRCLDDPSKWQGAQLRLTLVYDGDGKPVTGEKGAGPMLEFPQGCTRYGVPAAEVLLSMNEEGVTAGALGVLASTFRHLRDLRLVVARKREPDGGWETLPGRIRVWTASHARREGQSSSEESLPLEPTPPAGPKRPRRRVAAAQSPPPEPESPAPSFLPPDAPPSPFAPSPSSCSEASPLAASSVGDGSSSRLSTPHLPDPDPKGLPAPDPDEPPEGEDGPPDISVALEALRNLCIEDGAGPAAECGIRRPRGAAALKEALRAAASEAAAPLAALPSDIDDAARLLEAAAAAAESTRPCAPEDGPPLPLPAKCEGMDPPFRHLEEGGRAAILGRVHEARAAVRRAAAAAGLEHPVSAVEIDSLAADPSRRPLLRALKSACAELATTMASEAVFDTALFRSVDGRYHARSTLEDLRLCGTAGLLHGVLETWGATLSKALAATPYPKEDAVLLAEHAWSCLDVITGPVARTATVPDLLPVPRDFFFELLDRVDGCLAEHALGGTQGAGPERETRARTGRGPADPELAARALARRGRAHEQLRDSQGATEAYFEAWSLLVRAGRTPSRLEAHIVRELAEIHIRLPALMQMRTHLCGRMYWFCETEEDLFQEAMCLYTSGQESMLLGRPRDAKTQFRRCMDMLSSMSLGYRVMYPRAASLLIIASLSTFDIPTALWAFNRTFVANAALTGFGYFELDLTSPLRDRMMAHVEANVPLPGDSHPPTAERPVVGVGK